MMDCAAGLLVDLKALRKGRGVFQPQISEQVGPYLREVCGIADDDAPATVRQKIIERLGQFTMALPEDLGLAVAVALALHPEARQAFLTERIQWLASKISRDDRTARRRVDMGIVQLAEVAAGRETTISTPRTATHSDDWYVSELHAVVQLDRSGTRSIETRRIVAVGDSVDRLTIAVSLPRDPTDQRNNRDLLAEVLYGGTLVAKQHNAASQFRFELHLPHTLQVGESHEFALLLQVPEDQPMRTHYVHTSPRRCDSFDLRVRFGRDRTPHQVWRVAGVFHRELDEVAPVGDPLIPDPAGDLHLEFANLAPGFGYGVQWSTIEA